MKPWHAYSTPEGIKLIEGDKMPPEPTYGKWHYDDRENLQKALAYDKALQAAKASAVPIQNEIVAVSLIAHGQTILDLEKAKAHYCKPGTIYGPFTVGYRIEKQCQYKETDGNCPDCFRGSLCQKIAIIKESNEDEYQVWLEYGRLEMMYSFEGAEKNVSNPSRYVFDKIKEKFTITRTPEKEESQVDMLLEIFEDYKLLNISRDKEQFRAFIAMELSKFTITRKQ